MEKVLKIDVAEHKDGKDVVIGMCKNQFKKNASLSKDENLQGKEKGKRKLWFKRIAVALALVFCVSCGVVFFGVRRFVVHTISAAPYGVNVSLYDGADSRGFSWWTSETEESLLLLSKKQFNANEVYANKSYILIEDDASIGEGVYLLKGNNRTIKADTRLDKIFDVEYVNHSVAVKNLERNQKYYYAVGGNKHFVLGEFITETDNITTVCNFNDFQTSDGAKLGYGAKTLSAAKGLSYTELDFYAFGGDFSSIFSIGINRYNHYLGWMKSRESLNETIESAPLMMAKGNHDLAPELFAGNLAVEFAAEEKDTHYYSFDYNNVHFVVLDSNNFSLVQQDWLKADLTEAGFGNTLWKVIMVHNGPYTTGDHGFDYDENYVKTFSSICSQYKVDLVLQAHDHTYSKTFPYIWGEDGYYQDVNKANESVNFNPQEIEAEGIIYDYRPNGTYYVSCGASGHRIGENKEYAASEGEKSYSNRALKIAIGEIKVDSEYASIGDCSSADLSLTMFGILIVNDNKLTYSFYAVNEQGNAVLYDRLAVMK